MSSSFIRLLLANSSEWLILLSKLLRNHHVWHLRYHLWHHHLLLATTTEIHLHKHTLHILHVHHILHHVVHTISHVHAISHVHHISHISHITHIHVVHHIVLLESHVIVVVVVLLVWSLVSITFRYNSVAVAVIREVSVVLYLITFYTDIHMFDFSFFVRIFYRFPTFVMLFFIFLNWIFLVAITVILLESFVLFIKRIHE